MVKNDTFWLLKSASVVVVFFLLLLLPHVPSLFPEFFQVYKSLNVQLVFDRKMKNSSE